MSDFNSSDWKEYTLYPALWRVIDQAFPDMEFRFVGGYWRSPKHLDGSPSHSKDQTFVHYKKKWLIKDNNGDKPISLIDFEMMRSGSDFKTAANRLASICRVEGLPEYEPEGSKQIREKQERREEANKIFTSALWSGSVEANKVLDYLRNVRRWSDEEIREAELGYVDEAILAQIPDSEDYSFTTQSGAKIGRSHRLTIPYRNGERLFGFKFREIEASTREKYLNSKGLSKSAGLFGIGIGIDDITIVEGELDALHAKARGADNVVATTGSAASETQLEDALKRGVKRFTLLFDNDEAGQKFTASTIATIERKGGEVWVASLPEGYKDTDEYLAGHTLEEWKAVTDNATKASIWKYKQIYNKYASLCFEGRTLTLKQREDFFSEVEALINSDTTKEYDRELIFAAMKPDEDGLKFKVDELRDYLNKSYLRKAETKRATSVKGAVATLQDLAKDGKIDEALALMRETASTQSAKEKATEYAKIFAPLTPGDYAQLLSAINEGIPTGFTFKQGHTEEKLTLNAGLTFICGYRGHGKTSFLNNIALNEARRNVALQNGKSVLYFSYEIDKSRLILDLLNTFVNDPGLSARPYDTIRSYFRGASGGKYFRGDRLPDGRTHYENFLAQKETFFRGYLGSGALTIVDENYKVETLLDAIKYYVSTRPVSIVCIDYAQLIYSEDYSRLRTEEIKRVVNDIKDFANKIGIPFVLAAQFNRQVDSPIGVDTKNIGEGGDFERIADTCIGLFNLKELHPLKDSDERREACKLLRSLGLSLDEELKPVDGKLFVRLMKRRYGYYPLDTILDWTGVTKYIKPNDPEQLSTDPKELDLFEGDPESLDSGF